ncbi:hypothetical protein CPJCM30710_06580 [Clostridium polyendosporum]|uniref:Uncharacterized protein n=1 Tax=Clostridium polyendosporum TaxID=69208 RepID=A0A919VFC2_9CLOT|nr:GDYXXLXY domain-containing protein [Clostridium polyendosporum]GIM27992.1 hypothetical protein CPJCM30710_06580 [Clostridium polyendosporum]
MINSIKEFLRFNLFSKFEELNIKRKFLIVTLIPVIILLCMTILPLLTLYKGTEVSILANAYHSSDSFRGKNLYLEYKISNVTVDKLPDSIKTLNKNSNNRPINAYAVLKKSGDIYDLDYISIEKPKTELYLKCRVLPYFDESIDGFKKEDVYITYTLDRFFTSNENKSLNSYPENIEYNNNQWLYTAKIKIYNGYAILSDVQLR